MSSMTSEETAIKDDVLAAATGAQRKSYDLVVAHQGCEPDLVRTMLFGNGCIILKFPHITIGIETDGYAHS